MQTEHEKQVAAAIEQLRAAMISKDGNTLSALSCEELTYGHSNGKIETKAEFINTIVSGQSNFVSIQLSDAYLHITGNTVIARHTFLAETNDGGNPANIKLHIIWVWLLHSGAWKMLARQAVRLVV